ncbi:MAG: toll/interleukin-1 receptor domain-containing protein [Anaerolineales bacterium]|nr:toll/interleukin-1 receptor domain-containing protein [Anaerolineales bacterium]
MADQEQLGILKQGVDVWNKWREDNFGIEIDLSSAELTESNLAGVNLHNAYLRDAIIIRVNLTRSILLGADLSRAILTGANLARANLVGANFTSADLDGADLRESSLIGADLTETQLDGVNFSNAAFGRTTLVTLNLSQALNLDKAIHRTASALGMNTIHLSRGKIPDVFLRGCGLSNLDIEYSKLALPGLDPDQVIEITNKIYHHYLGDSIQYYSSFISYNSKDQEFAQQLHNDLQENGVRCWFAPEDMKIGDQIRPTIDRQIRSRDKLLVILSENSVQSEWVGDEVEAALEQEKALSKIVLLPIRLDDTALNIRDGWMAKIKRTRHIGDFSNWKNEGNYRKAFGRLLRDLWARDVETGR